MVMLFNPIEKVESLDSWIRDQAKKFIGWSERLKPNH
jgi:hypothetical protein